MQADSRLKSLFTEHLILKTLALTLAAITVYGIRSITNQTENFEVPIVVKVGKGVAVLKQDARIAYITCRGSYEDLNRLDVNELKVIVEPKNTNITDGERIPIGPGNVKGWIRGVKITSVSPGFVFVSFDREIEKVVGVAAPETVGKPLLGKAEVTYEPKMVTIRGPESKLREMKILRTEPIDVEGAAGAFNMRSKILTEGQNEVWHIEPSEVMVHINIVTEAISRNWENIRVLALVDNECGSNLHFSPEFVNVSLHGSPRAVNTITEKDINVFVNCVGITNSDTKKIAADVHLPPGANLSAAVDPPIITVSSAMHQISTNTPATSVATPTNLLTNLKPHQNTD